MPPKPSDEELYQLSKGELVNIIKTLQLEIARLKQIVSKDSKTSSKPPSQDIIKKSEKRKKLKTLHHSGDIKAYREGAGEFKSKLTNAFNQWIPKAGATALNLLSKLRDKYDQWCYFLEHPEVPPDNNLAERSLRLAVTKRKVSGGSRSLSRFDNTASLLTVVQTCRFQQRCVIDFFGEALRAHVGHQIAYPSLIPILVT